MCGWSEEDLLNRSQPDLALLEPARALAARLDGASIPAESWDIFFGRAGGAVAWSHLETMRKSYAIVFRLNLMKANAGRRRGRLFCSA